MDLESEFEGYASLMKLAEGEAMTGVEIGAVITALRNSFDIVKNSVDAVDAGKQAELIRAIASMNLELSKLEGELAAKNRDVLRLTEENTSLAKQLAELKKPSIENLVCKGSEYFTEESNRGPYCPNCYENGGLRILLNEIAGAMYKCSKCKYSRTT